MFNLTLSYNPLAYNKADIKRHSLFITVLLCGLSFVLLTCESAKPCLCDCLTNYRNNPGGCDAVFEETYKTDLPTAQQMIDDYVVCKDFGKYSG